MLFMKPTKEHILAYLHDLKLELQRDGIVQLGLFGSYARGDNTLYSDIDIAIKKEINYLQHRNAYTYFDEVAKIKQRIFETFHCSSDIFDLDSSSRMKESIMKEIIYV
jgi:predicted nucleotidyltransferase